MIFTSKKVNLSKSNIKKLNLLILSLKNNIKNRKNSWFFYKYK